MLATANTFQMGWNESSGDPDYHPNAVSPNELPEHDATVASFSV